MASRSRIFDYFVVCGMGPEIRTLEGDSKGYLGTDVMKGRDKDFDECVLPGGVRFYASGYDSNDVSTFPRSYPIVLTEGDGSKIYVSCIAFRDPVCEDIAEAYHIPANSFADKCICLVSRLPSFGILRDALEELFILCFSPSGSRDRVLFSIESCLLSVETPPKEGLPHADVYPFDSCIRGHLPFNISIQVAGSFTHNLALGAGIVNLN
ncbi:hypothetical protein QJS10_CPA09g01337 [Acorus calamus]|uniref:uDENN domain-containing protein n=1 Tax=Acorus calamus TaxID=4465 RepID=A0AAV9E3H6_ACOCL|nr:hypothetical protein QJS10_CPA09g01337 [Acorus calamus]